MNMVHDMDKDTDVYKICYVQESNHTRTARTHARVCGSWEAKAISYSLKILRKHPLISQLLFDLFFNASSSFRY